MYAIMKYKCSCCGAEHDDEKTALAHEAAHFGLSYDDYALWLDLRRTVARTSYKNGQTNTAQTRLAYDKPIQQLLAFETTHNLDGASQPITV